MIERLTSIEDYMEFAKTVVETSDYCDPHFESMEELKSTFERAKGNKQKQILGVKQGDIITGLFMLLVIQEDQYVEMVYGLSMEQSAYEELFEYLKDNCAGYHVDFVFNPKNDHLTECLKKQNADFDTEQMKMVYKNHQKIQRKNEVVVYQEKYKEQYLAIHATEGLYWTGEKVIEATDKFRIILGLADDKVVGYVDVSHCYDENEPYDVFVLEAYRNRGIAADMLTLALELNGEKGMMLLVDVDNEAAIHLYEKLGFENVNKNNITASFEL